VINKADHPGAGQLQREMEAALALDHRADGWKPPVVRTVASEGQGIEETLAAIAQFRERTPRGRRDAEAWVLRLREMVRERLLERISADRLRAAAERVARRETDPYSAAEDILGYSCLLPPEEHLE